jgi:four helix bundle protein
MCDSRASRIRSHRDLIIWQRSMELVNETYELTEAFPRREVYGLVAQMRSAAVSISANIAEGQGRSTTKDFLRFLAMSRGSLRELDTYCEVSLLRRYASEQSLQNEYRLLEAVGQLHTALCAALRRKLRAGP